MYNTIVKKNFKNKFLLILIIYFHFGTKSKRRTWHKKNFGISSSYSEIWKTYVEPKNTLKAEKKLQAIKPNAF